MLPPANGEIGEIILIMDSSQYQGELGEAVRSTFNISVEALPQDESMFNMHYANPLRVNSVLRRARNLLYVTTLDDKSDDSKTLRALFTNESLKKIYNDTTEYVRVKKDEYAEWQTVMHLYGKNSRILTNHIYRNQDYLREIFERLEIENLKKKIFASREKEIERTLRIDHGYSIKVPYGYDIAKNLPNFSWFRFLEADHEKNIFIHYQDFTSQDQLSDMAAYRDEITTTYLRDSEKPSLYITYQDILPALTDTITFKKKFALRNKGLWKISDNSGGGPYISYTFVDEENARIYYIEGYVYAPGRQKKNYIRELDAILSTFKTPSEVTVKASQQ